MKTNLMFFTLTMVIFSTLFISQPYAQICNIELNSLSVPQNNYVIAFIKNLGNITTADFRFFINNELKHNGSTVLAEDENQRIVYDYDFSSPGTYQVKVEVTASCGAYTEQTLTHYVFGHTYCTNPPLCEEGAVKCDRENERLFVCENEQWMPFAQGSDLYCEYCCDTYSCSAEPGNSVTCITCPVNKEDCSVIIEEFDYSTNLIEGNKADVTAEIRNTGKNYDWFTLKFYVDGIAKAEKSFSLNPDQTKEETLYFYPEAGSHDVELRAFSGCASDSASAKINVLGLSDPVIIPQPEKETEPTEITLGSDNLDIPIHEAKGIALNIHSAQYQKFRISIDSVDRNWVNYPQSTYINGDETLYIYITPEDSGHYIMNVYVRAMDENLYFRREVSFYVVPEQKTSELADVGEFLVIVFTSPIMIIIMSLGLFYFVIQLGSRYLKWGFPVDKTEKISKI